MKSILNPWLRSFAGVAFLTALVVPSLAFPPAPHHRLFGQVRDELGNRLTEQDALVLLETSAGVQLGAPVAQRTDATVNYQLDVPMDSGITDDAFKPTALKPTVPFTIKVRVGSRTYLPIEMAGAAALNGRPGGKTRLDLTLGEDLDGDGLPDAWERILISQSRQGLGLNDILPTDDFDGDGMSNLNEYLAGTYAFDNKDGYALEIVEKKGDRPVLAFTAVRGRNYTVHGSSDLSNWVPLTFLVEQKGVEVPETVSAYQATDSRVIQVQAVVPEATAKISFFKLMIE